MSGKLAYSIGVDNNLSYGPNSGYGGYATYPNLCGTRALQIIGGSKHRRSRSKKKTNKKNKNSRKMRLRKKSKKHKHTKYCKHNKKSRKKRKTRRKIRGGNQHMKGGSSCGEQHIAGGSCGSCGNCGMIGGSGCGGLSTSGYSLYPEAVNAKTSALATPMPRIPYSTIN